MRSHVHAAPDIEMRRTELVDKDKRPNHRARFARKCAPHLEHSQIVAGGGDFQHRKNICPVGILVKAVRALILETAFFA
jgi:hypothetical protein